MELYLEVIDLDVIDLKAINLTTANLETVDREACPMDAQTVFIGQFDIVGMKRIVYTMVR